MYIHAWTLLNVNIWGSYQYNTVYSKGTVYELKEVNVVVKYNRMLYTHTIELEQMSY